MTWFNVLSIKLNCRGDVDGAWTESPGEKRSARPSSFPSRRPTVMDTDQLGAGLERMGEARDTALPHPGIAIIYFPIVREELCESGPGSVSTSRLSRRHVGGVKWGWKFAVLLRWSIWVDPEWFSSPVCNFSGNFAGIPQEIREWKTSVNSKG